MLLRVLIAGLLTALLVLGATAPRAQQMLLHAGCVKAACTVGPLDIAGPALGCWSTRACSGSNASGHSNVLRLCNSSGASCLNVTANTNGSITAPGATACGGSACTNVATIFDQSGNGHDMTQATAANQPTFAATGLNSLPVIQFPTTSISIDTSTVSPIANQNAPMTMSMVLQDTGVAGGGKHFVSDDGFLSTIDGFGTTTAMSSQIAGTSCTTGITSLSQAHFHSFQNLYNSGTNACQINVDGSTNTGSPSVANPILHNLYINPSFTGSPGTLNMTELVLWASDQYTAHASALISNQTTYWGPL